MTISTVVPDIAFPGSGGAGTLGPFSLIKSGTPIVFYANSDIYVYRYDTVTDEAPVLLVEGTDYTLTGGPTAGSVLLTSPQTGLLTAERLYVVRKQALAQSLDLVNGGNFSSSNLERRLDVIETKLQEQARDIKSTVRFAMFDTDEIPGTVPLDAAIDKIPYITGTAASPSIAFIEDADTWGDFSQFTEAALEDIAIVAADLAGADTIGIVAAAIDDVVAVATDIASVITVADALDEGLLFQRRTLESFGAVGDGSTDDLAAINTALAAGVPLAGTPGKTYRYVGRLLAPSRFNFDGNGCTLRPVYAAATGDTAGQRYAIYSSLGTFGAINTVSVQTAGTRVVTLSTTPSGIAVGDMICFFGTSLSSRWPITYRTVVGISGNDVTVDELIPYAIGGTITCRKIVPNPEFVLKNCTIDCTDLTDGTAEVDGVIRTLSYRDRILKNLKITNLDIDPTSTDYIFYADYCLDVVVENCTVENAIRNGSFDSVFRARSYTARGNRYSGDGFGFAPVNCDSFWIEDNEISGQHTTIVGTSYSVRGIRPIGCLEGSIIGNTITDIDSGIKLEDCANIIVRGNFVRYCDTGVNFSDQYPDARSGGHIIMDNIIEEYTENGIALGTTGSGDGLWKPIILQGNRVGTTNASASQPILIRGGTIEASGNVIYDWPSGVVPFQTATADGQLSKGILGSLYAVAPTATGRLGVTIDATHTGIAIDHDSVVCNAPAGKFAALPPRRLSVPYVLASGGGTFSHTGNTSETAVGPTVVLPGGSLGANGALRVTTVWEVTASTDAKTLRWKLGSTSFMSRGLNTASVSNKVDQRSVHNVNSQSVQVGYGTNAATSHSEIASVALVAGAIDTSVDQNITFTVTLANSGETATLKAYLIEVIYGA